MRDRIGGYLCLGDMQTTGSGSARWCMAMRGTERFFLKEFLSPVYPVNSRTPIGKRQQDRCLRFEEKKQKLYASASCVLGDVLVPVVDFFRESGHYYAVSEAVPDGCLTAERTAHLTDEQKRKLLLDLATGIQLLHRQGIVHADLKPEHVLLFPDGDSWKPRLIDLDSGFLLEDPPRTEQEMEGDPVYLSPEAFLLMAGEQSKLGTAMDTFAFGAVIHQIWCGKLPDFDRTKYHYLYEAALDGAEIHLELPEEWKEGVAGLLRAKPEERPSDAQITALFAQHAKHVPRMPLTNGLQRLMKKVP